MWRCEKHFAPGNFGDLPCPWPGCENGTPNERIEDTFAGVGDSIVHERVSLPAHDGRERFFWRNPSLPWFFISTAIRNYELARVHRPLYVTSHVYHYTTFPAFKNIIANQELWLTDYAYVNDSSEVKHGLTLAASVFEQRLSSADAAIRSMLDVLLSLPVDEQPRIYIACFSFGRDNLTQWKGYGHGTQGIAFGVEPMNFYFEIGHPMEMTLAPVIYDDGVKRDLLENFVRDWAVLYERDRASGDPQWLAGYPRAPRSYFFELVSTFKHSSFADEREFRYVYREDPLVFNDQLLMKVKQRFRASDSLIVPYTTTKDLAVFRLRNQEKIKKSDIKMTDVIIGPHVHGELAAAGVRELLVAQGYSNVPVYISAVPYR
jgi:hypothetical protein